ncbi:3-oxoadipyl-CoA thiolase [Oceanospirillaceae bacterium]|nr:3-oxoadipyl-CoA thiolase [Oceanospirillaceae bacterium]MDC1341411.1 3-oxoadipyl-CoA thiolase [Oceanospirillaceae bacterium]
MNDAFICDAIRTPFGKYGGSLASVRADDLGALPIKALMERSPNVDWVSVDDVFYGCANQAGEDNRNVARMSGLLAGLPVDVPGVTLNRLCGSGMDTVGTGARAIRSGEADLIIAGGVESMSRAPFVIAKAETAFSRQPQMFDTTMGWRFVNRLMAQQYGVDSMPETAENVATQFHIDRKSQDAFAFSSQTRAAKAQAEGIFKEEIVSVRIPQRNKEDLIFSQDEHLRLSSLDTLSKLATPFKDGGSVTAGNASGINDGACALLLASNKAVKRHGLTPKARILGMATAGLAPNIMGYGPVAASLKVLKQTGLTLEQMDVIELNEAFAAQSLAVMRALGIADNAAHVNPNGGAIALGHPLGASGARLVTTAMYQLHRSGGRYALCTMCIGVGQGIAIIIERV